MSKLELQEPVQLQSSSYFTNEDEAILSFVQHNPEIAFILMEAYYQVRLVFGEAKLGFEVASDPEAAYPDQLIMQVYTSLPVKEAIDKLHEIDQNWGLYASKRSQGRFIIDVAPLPAA